MPAALSYRSPLAGFADRIVYLADHQITVLTADKSIVTHRETGRIRHRVHTLDIEATEVQLGDFAHYMLTETCERPQSLAATLRVRQMAIPIGMMRSPVR